MGDQLKNACPLNSVKEIIMKVIGHLMSKWGQRALKEMVKEVRGRSYGGSGTIMDH